MERSITKEIRRLDHVIRKRISEGNEAHRQFSFTQFQVIRYLFVHENEDICQKDLEAETGLRKASMTECLNVLEEKGLIVRENAKDDRRKNYIRMTDVLKGYGDDLRDRVAKLDAIITKDIPQEDLDVFYRVSECILRNIEGERI